MNYKETLNLPQTDFPMKANLATREPEILAMWKAEDTWKKVRQGSTGKSLFILHDGPPFANGHIHLGHALNKTLKDIVVRYQTMRGHDVPYIPGWDCHGLPIEHQVMKSLGSGDRDPVTIRRDCAAFAAKFIDIQKQEFIRLGVWGDWDNPYLTMSPAYEAEILRNLAQLLEKNLVYQDLKPVFWSTGCRTALAEAEVEYQDRHDPSIYVAFPVNSQKLHLVVWTTTPWTLPANLAVAVHPQLKYVFLNDGQRTFIIAESRAHELEKLLGKKLSFIQSMTGEELAASKLTYRHPFLEDATERRLFTALFVTSDTGSGIVHIAPGHGHDDYALGKEKGLPPYSPVDHAGKFIHDGLVPQQLVGKYVLDANKDVIQILKDKELLLGEEQILHSYPHCWRSKTPIIFRSVKQWFIRVDAFRDEALQNIEKVTWHPAWGKNRMSGSVSARQDWCISRQRTWGIPIPVFYEDETVHLDAATVRKFADHVEKEGSDIWFAWDEKKLTTTLGVPAHWKRGQDTLDVWIDSGSSFQAVVKKKLGKKADLYLEGSDQHRGWFQSSLLIATAAYHEVPYKAVLTHGFVVDGEGRKMSKSLGNVIAPQDVMKEFGADILRLWVVSSDYSDDVRISKDIFNRIADSYRKIRNTFRFLLGNLSGFVQAEHEVPQDQLLESDRWILSRLAWLIQESTRLYDAYEYHKFYQILYNFCTTELSSIYFDILKDRLYTDKLNSLSGRSSRTALYHICVSLLKILAPVMPFTCEEAWSHMKSMAPKAFSVHALLWPLERVADYDPALENKWIDLLAFREKVLKKLEEKRERKEIGNSLEAIVEVTCSDTKQLAWLQTNQKLLTALLLVSGIKILGQNNSLQEAFDIQVYKSPAPKCARCWMRLEEVGTHADHPELCNRCVEVVR